jgi:hypothetical protein
MTYNVIKPMKEWEEVQLFNVIKVLRDECRAIVGNNNGS